MSKVKITYEKVDITSAEIAKAMIDGEVFYNKDGAFTYEWNGWGFVEDSAPIAITGDFYRKVETPIKWYEDIPEGGVLCQVKYAGGRKTLIVKITTSNKDCYMGSALWDITTPLTKEEIKVFMDNAPE